MSGKEALFFLGKKCWKTNCLNKLQSLCSVLMEIWWKLLIVRNFYNILTEVFLTNFACHCHFKHLFSLILEGHSEFVLYCIVEHQYVTVAAAFWSSMMIHWYSSTKVSGTVLIYTSWRPSSHGLNWNQISLMTLIKQKES